MPPQIGDIVLFKKVNDVNTLSYRTLSANSETADKQWVVVDAEGQTLGRLASKVAKLIRGKHKPNFTPHVDCGDNVIVINAEKIKLSSGKMETKEYVRHTGYPGGQKFTLAKDMIANHPERVIEKAIKGMLPKTKLGRQIFGNLYVYTGTDHPHQGQKPETLEIK